MIRVVIADEEEMVREGFRLLLRRAADIEVVGAARDGHEAVQLAQELYPDVVTMDIGMPRLNGLRATQQITIRRANTRILMVSSGYNEALIAQALQSGASGYVAKRGTFEALVPAIRAVRKGKSYFSASVSTLVHGMTHNPFPQSPRNPRSLEGS